MQGASDLAAPLLPRSRSRSEESATQLTSLGSPKHQQSRLIELLRLLPFEQSLIYNTHLRFLRFSSVLGIALAHAGPAAKGLTETGEKQVGGYFHT